MSSAPKLDEPQRSRPHADAGAKCCPRCGAAADESDESVIKRGAVVVAFDPVAVWWRGQYVALSPIEALLYARIAQRGRMLYTDIDAYLREIGASAATRPVVLGHVRRKFLNLGACDPFERLGKVGVRLRVDPDERGFTTPLIGLRMPRYASTGETAGAGRGVASTSR